MESVKVYVLSSDLEYECSDIIGIFSTNELAESCVLSIREHEKLRPKTVSYREIVKFAEYIKALKLWESKAPNGFKDCEYWEFKITEHTLDSLALGES